MNFTSVSSSETINSMKLFLLIQFDSFLHCGRVDVSYFRKTVPHVIHYWLKFEPDF